MRKHLAEMLSHPTFSGVRRLSSLLRFLVEEMLAGRGDQLKEYTLGVAVFDRGTRFDPRLDSIVRVEASKLRSRLASYYKTAGVNDNFRIELPRGSYVPRIIPHEVEADTIRPTGAVAVLPFVPLGPEPETEYLSDGLTEEIIDRLGTIPGMRVVARTSTFQFKGKTGNIQEIGRTLGAEYLIEGSVRQAQNRLRVNARLIDAATGYRVWSGVYDKTPDDLFTIQIVIANEIGMALGGRDPLSRERNGLSAEAYRLYLRGRFHRNQWTLEGFEKGVDYFRQALSLEPESAQVLAALSEVEVMRTGVACLPAAPSLERARAAAERAIVLDDHCAQAHLALGWIRHIYDWQWDSGLAEFNRAIAVNPNCAEAWHLKGLFLALRGCISEAEDSFGWAMRIDPLSLVIQIHRAMVPYFAGKLDEAERRVRAALAIESNFAESHWVLGYIYERQKRYREALEAFQAAIRIGGENPLTLADIAFLHTCLGDLQSAREIVARLAAGFPRPHPSGSGLARVCLGLGERAAAEAWLEEAFEARDAMLPWACCDSRYEAMWTLPGFSAFRQRILGRATR